LTVEQQTGDLAFNPRRPHENRTASTGRTVNGAIGTTSTNHRGRGSALRLAGRAKDAKPADFSGPNEFAVILGGLGVAC
jgi:hypothetical protein